MCVTGTSPARRHAHPPSLPPAEHNRLLDVGCELLEAPHLPASHVPLLPQTRLPAACLCLSRAFLSCLTACFPGLPLLGLVDWNPCGANILCIYRFGSHRMGLESPHYALPALGWLGARSSQLQQADAGAFQVGPGPGGACSSSLLTGCCCSGHQAWEAHGA